jgi:hypothetical protein
VTVPEYAAPTVAVAGALPVTFIAGELTVMFTVVVPTSWGVPLSWTDTGIANVPAAVGVPLIVSVAPLAFAVSPAGSPATAPHV